MTELELIEGIANGDHSALKALVDQHQALVLNTCYSFIGNREDAEDVAQEVFLQVYKSAKKFRGDSKIATWLYRIAVNMSLNYMRDNKKHTQLLSIDSEYKDQDSMELPDSDIGPADHLQKKELKSVLNSALEALPENQKTAFILNKIRELPYKEIAAVMKKSVSSVESLIHRAKLNLQQELIEYFEKN